MKINNIEGEVVKDNDVYILKDNTDLKSLVLSSTLLHTGTSTRCHSHPGQEEIYMIMDGQGKMQLDDKMVLVKEGEVILIEDGVFIESLIQETSLCIWYEYLMAIEIIKLKHFLLTAIFYANQYR